MSDAYDIPPSLRRHRTPPPRDIGVVTEEQHCPPGCVHLAEARRRGFEEGARAERERQDQESSTALLAAALAFLVGLCAAAIVRWGAAWLAGR